jgi:alpha-methylacyl-CoA racemase
VLERPAARADVAIIDLRLESAKRLGIDPSSLHVLNERLIVCTVTGFGWQNGNAPGHDINYVALTGVLENALLPPPLQAADALGALLAVAGILAELQNRCTFVHVDIALTNAALLAALPALACALNDTAMEALSGGLPWYVIHRCSDGRMIALGALEPKFRELFCQMVGRPDLLTRERDDLQVALTNLFASRSQSEWLDQLAADLPVTPVLTLQEAVQQIKDASATRRGAPLLGQLLGSLLDAELVPLGADTDAILADLGIAS